MGFEPLRILNVVFISVPIVIDKVIDCTAVVVEVAGPW